MNIGRGITRLSKPKGFHGIVISDLGRGIVKGSLPVDSILPRDAELQERFGVSRTVLREALKTLAAKGMVQPKAKVGTRVLSRENWNLFDPEVLKWHTETGAVDAPFLFSLQEMRFALEPEAARLAALRRTSAQLAALFHWADKMGQHGTGAAFVEADLRFHLMVAEASQNPFMRAISAVIEVALTQTFTVSSPILNTDQHRTVVARHRAVAEAISRRDADGARAAMRQVIQDGVDQVAGFTNPPMKKGA